MSYKEYKKQWKKDNPQKVKSQQQRKYQRHQQKYLEKRKHYRTKNHQELLQQNREYRQNNPEKFVKYSIKHFIKYSLNLNLTQEKFRSALYFWAKAIKKINNNQCQICGESADHSHHIFPKAKYPQLALNLNNGIALCFEHHKEAHGWKV